MKRLALAAVLLSALRCRRSLARSSYRTRRARRIRCSRSRADGSPRVAFVAANGSIVFATRDGRRHVGRADACRRRSRRPALVGPRSSARPAPSLLLEASNGSRLSSPSSGPTGLARAHRRDRAAERRRSASAASRIGHDGRPLVAYAYLLKTQKSYLRLVHEDASGRLIGEAVTRKGFPPSIDLPTVTPIVLPSGAVRIVEAYSGADDRVVADDEPQGLDRAVPLRELARRARRASSGRSPTPPAAPGARGRSSSPTSGESDARAHAEPERPAHDRPRASTPSSSALARGAGRPRGRRRRLRRPRWRSGRSTPASCSTPQGITVELDGNLEGYAIDPAGARDYLLARRGRRRVVPLPHRRRPRRVALSAAVSGASFVLSGRSRARRPAAASRSGARRRRARELVDHPPTRSRRQLLAHRHAAGAAAHLPRGVPRRERAAARGARAHGARRVNRVFHRLHKALWKC